METKKTAGQIVSELMQKTPDTTDPIELQRAQEEEYIKCLIGQVQWGKKHLQGDFFIEVNSKKERALAGMVTRNLHAARQSCPTPFYDQAVYKYFHAVEELAFIWVIPDQGTCAWFQANALNIPSDQKELLNFVLSYYDGSLLQLAKKLNNEADEAPSIILFKES